MKPNLFAYATKELSQDAFLCWFMNWAGDQYDDDKELQKSAKDFITMLINKQIPYTKEIHTVCVKKQWEKIDIKVVVNNEIFIVIEDKTGTGAHGNQLKVYKEKAQSECAKPENKYKLVCIYLKTGNEASVSKKAEAEGYSFVGREAMLEIFEKCKTSNAIFNDYVEHIQGIQNATESFLTTPVADWSYCAWEGFYMFLEKGLCNETGWYDWKYEANPSRGYLGFSWNFKTIKNEMSLFLHIEQGDLCIKIGTDSEHHLQIRSEWHHIVMETAKVMGLDKIHKPKRFGSGKCMTIAKVNMADYLGEAIIDKEKVIENLKKYEALIDKCVERITL